MSFALTRVFFLSCQLCSVCGHSLSRCRVVSSFRNKIIKIKSHQRGLGTFGSSDMFLALKRQFQSLTVGINRFFCI